MLTAIVFILQFQHLDLRAGSFVSLCEAAGVIWDLVVWNSLALKRRVIWQGNIGALPKQAAILCWTVRHYEGNPYPSVELLSNFTRSRVNLNLAIEHPSSLVMFRIASAEC